MNEDGATLSVGFAIDTGGAFAELMRFSQMFDDKTVQFVRQAAEIERATGGMVALGRATADVQAFGAASTKALQAASREAANAERAGERIVAQLERQNAAFGKTREQLRATKVEEAALAAERVGNTDLAQRLREQEQALFDQEFAATRRAQQAAQDVAETKMQAAAEAVAAAEREALAVKNATEAYRAFEAVAKQKMAIYREEQAANEASRLNAEREAVSRLAQEHAQLAAQLRASRDAEAADAVAAERLREATDPLYAAVKRLNAEIAESTRLYHNGATAPAEYARQQEVLAGRLRSTTAEHEAMAAAGGHNATAMRNLAIQMPDVVQGLLTGQKPFTILIQQGGQLVQVAMMAEGGLKAMALAAGTLLAYLLPVAAIAAVGAGAIKLFQEQVKSDGDLTHFRDNLGLTRKEMLQLGDGVEEAGGKFKKLGDVTVTFGDVFAGIWKTIQDNAGSAGHVWDDIKGGALTAFKAVLEGWNVVSAGITASGTGTLAAVTAIWSSFPAAFGDLFVQGVNAAIGALNKLVKFGVDQLNGLISTVNKVPGVNVGQISAPQIAPIDNANAGAAAKAAKAIGNSYATAYADARKADAAFWKQVGDNAKQHAKDRLTEEANALKAERTPKKPKVDHHAENLAREAEAVEAQISGLYRLADAYQVSAGAALIAEAREKAESSAIKKRGDIEEFVARQVRLAIAQRVADAAKATASLTEQAAMQEAVNAKVEAGLVPAARAAQLIQDQTALLPLLAAQQAAQLSGDALGYANATAAIDGMTAAQKRSNAAKAEAALDTASASGALQIAQLQQELALIGATDEARARSIATLKATQDVAAWGVTDPAKAAAYIQQQADIAALTVKNAQAQEAYNASLTETADHWDIIAGKVQSAAQGMADAFGASGKAIGDVAAIYADYHAQRSRADAEHDRQVKKADGNQILLAQETKRYALQSSGAQIAAYGDMIGAAKGFFKEGSAGYKTLEATEKAFRAVQLALAIKNTLEQVGLIGTHVAAKVVGDGVMAASDTTRSGIEQSNSLATTAVKAVEAVVNAIKSLPFPANIIAGAATAAAIATLGVAAVGGFGGSTKVDPGNTGTGTVLGDSSAKSDSIKNAIDALKEVDTVTNSYSRQMKDSLRSIDSQIGNLAAVLVRSGNISADSSVSQGFKPNAIGSVLGAIPLIGGFLSSLFGSKTEVTASGLYGGAQSIGSVLNGGYNAQSYSDVTKTSKFLGITTGKKNSTVYGSVDPALADQFTLILKSFNDAIVAASGPLGEATGAIQSKLNSFVVNIGKIDLKGLTGAEIQDKLNAVFGAAADSMANAAFPGIQQFQKVGEGAFETLVRVSSTVEAVTTALDQMGGSAQKLSVAAKLGLADQFDSVSDFTSAIGSYFDAYYSKEEQAAAKTAQFTKVFDSLGLKMPATLDAFRALVEAQDLTTTAGQSVYATLLQLAPAFADLQQSLAGAKSAADIVSEREDLQRQLLDLQGDTAAIRALDLAKIDPSNRALQQQVWALADAQDAAKNAQSLADAWKSVGDTLLDEVKRIRGLTDTNTDGGFASLLGQFNAATAAARGGDQDAAKSLTGLSQSLLTAAGNAATSRQELDRIRAETAASLEATYGVITALTKVSSNATSGSALTAAAEAAGTPTTASANDDLASEIRSLRDEVTQLRTENNAGHAANAGNTGRIAKKMDDVTAASGGDAISVAQAA